MALRTLALKRTTTPLTLSRCTAASFSTDLPRITERRPNETGRGGRASDAGVKVALFGATGFLGRYVSSGLGELNYIYVNTIHYYCGFVLFIAGSWNEVLWIIDGRQLEGGEHIIISHCPKIIHYLYIIDMNNKEGGKLVINAFMELPSEVAFHVYYLCEMHNRLKIILRLEWGFFIPVNIIDGWMNWYQGHLLIHVIMSICY